MTQPSLSQRAARTATVSSAMLGFVVFFMVMNILHLGRDIFIPFVVALFIWYLINAIARAMTLMDWGREMPAFWRFTSAIVALVGLMSIVVVLVSRNIRDVVARAPEYQAKFEVIIPKLMAMVGVSQMPTVSELLSHIDLGAAMTAFARTFTGVTGEFLIVLFYVGFLLYEQKFFNRKIVSIFVDRRSEKRLRHVLKKIDVKIQRYIGVKAFVSAVDSFLTFMILKSTGVNFAEFWGIMAFFLHFIPYAGSFIAISMPSAIALIQFSEPTQFIVVVTTLCISHAFIGHILDPYLMGNNLNLSPIFIVSSLAMWGMIWGIPGMFLAIPILAAITITLSQFPRTKPLAVLFSKTGVLDARRGKR